MFSRIHILHIYLCFVFHSVLLIACTVTVQHGFIISSIFEFFLILFLSLKMEGDHWCLGSPVRQICDNEQYKLQRLEKSQWHLTLTIIIQAALHCMRQRWFWVFRYWTLCQEWMHFLPLCDQDNMSCLQQINCCYFFQWFSLKSSTHLFRGENR